MSKRRSRKQTAGRRTGGVGAEGIAVRLAGIRWFLLSIEKRATELIMTNPAAYDRIEPVLFAAWVQIKPAKVQRLSACPPPWKLCDDECRPECDDIRIGEPQ
jgi:hypothetical protein